MDAHWQHGLESGAPEGPALLSECNALTCIFRTARALSAILQPHLIQLEYVWVGGLSDLDMRS